MGNKIISIYFFISVIITIYLGASVRYRNGNAHLRMVMPLTLLMTIYIFGYSKELIVATYEDAYFWNTFEYLAIPLITPVWLHIGMIYTGLLNTAKKRKLTVLYTIPLISIFLRLTNPLHYLYFSDLIGEVQNNRFILIQVKGPGYYVQFIFALIILMLTIAVYIYAYNNKRYVNLPIIRYMIFATTLSSIALALKTIDLLGLHLDYLALVMPINVIALYIAIFKHDFFEIQALAFEKAFDSSQDAMLLIDNYYSILAYNKEAIHLFGEFGVELEKRNIQELLREITSLSEAILDCEDKTIGMEVKGSRRYYTIQSNQITDSNQREHGRLFVMRDTTQEQLLHKTLLYNATIDDLSGLLNRRTFLEKAEALYESRNPSMLLMLDIDFFKKVNDTYGHAIGDKVIKGVGKKLSLHFGPTATIGRIGGEEFAVFLACTSKEKTMALINSFRKSIEDAVFDLPKSKVKVTISIGVSHSDKSLNFNQLIIGADKALYRAKNSGRNKVCE